MMRIAGIFMALFLIMGIGPDGCADVSPYDGRIGYSTDGIRAVRHKDTRLAFRVWTQELSQQENLKVDIEFFDEPMDAVNRFTEHQFDLLAVNPYFYLRKYREVQRHSKYYWVIQTSDSIYEKMLLLVRRDSGITDVKGLEQKKVMTRDNGYMSKLFFDRLVRERMHRGYEGFIGELLGVERYSTAVLKTFFRKVDACIVPQYVYNLMAEMNPSLRKELQVIAESPKIFVNFMMVAHKEMPERMVRAYENTVNHLEHTERGRQIMELFKMKKITRVTPHDLEAIAHYYEEYLALKQRQRGHDE